MRAFHGVRLKNICFSGCQLNHERNRRKNMPFIRGRYHINPVLGEAMEAAREAEAALAALEQAAAQENDKDADELGTNEARSKKTAKGPVHRVEIEAAEMVPSHTGHATRGYVARVHREHDGETDETQDASGVAGGVSHRAGSAANGRTSAGPPAETHVFADHRDLVGFLRDELAKDCGR
jgi:hypothetical protein